MQKHGPSSHFDQEGRTMNEKKSEPVEIKDPIPEGAINRQGNAMQGGYIMPAPTVQQNCKNCRPFYVDQETGKTVYFNK